MFLEGTLHVLWIYFILGLILCVPPILLPKWKSLVQFFNKKEISNKKFIRIFLVSLGLIITVIAVILMTIHSPHLLNIQFSSFRTEYLIFNFYTFFSFILLPFACALIGCASYVKNSSSVKLGNFFIILIALFALALAGSFFHDVLWCGTRTELYTLEVNAGYDLDWWRNVLYVESKDYRMFGFYMTVLTIILLIYASILLWKLEIFTDNGYDNNAKLKIFLFSSLLFIELGVALYVMEYFRMFTFIPTFIATYIGIPSSLVLSHLLGKLLANRSRGE